MSRRTPLPHAGEAELLAVGIDLGTTQFRGSLIALFFCFFFSFFSFFLSKC